MKNDKRELETLDRAEIKKYDGLSLSVGTYDASISILYQFCFILLIFSIPPPVISIMLEKFSYFNIILLFSFLFFLPLLIVSIIEIVLHIKFHNDEIERGYNIISLIAFYNIPIIFLIYIPMNEIELFIWIITLLGFYIGFWRERMPIIRYGIEMAKIEWNKYKSNKKIVSNVIPSQICLNLTLWFVLLFASFKIYPICFLMIFYLKYFFRKKYFSDYSNDFYKNWNIFEKKYMKLCNIIAIISTLIIGFQIGFNM